MSLLESYLKLAESLREAERHVYQGIYGTLPPKPEAVSPNPEQVADAWAQVQSAHELLQRRLSEVPGFDTLYEQAPSDAEKQVFNFIKRAAWNTK